MAALDRLRTLASDSAIYGLSGIIVRFLSVWLVPVYTRLFSPEDYGVMGLVSSTVAMIGIFVVLALDNSAARWYWDTNDPADQKRSISSAALCQIAVASVFAVGLWAVSDFLAARIVEREDAGRYFRLMALTLPLSQFGIVTIGWLRMQRRPVATMVYALGTGILQIALTLLAVVGLRWGLTGVYAGQVASLVVGAVVAVALLRDWINPAHFSFARLREMLRYALPLIPAGVAVWVVGFSDRYFVQHFTSTAEVGLYSVGSSIAGIVLLFTGAFQQAWGPFALSIHKQPDARQTYANVFLAYAILTAMLAAAVSLFAPEAIMLLATERYLGAASVVGLLSLGFIMVGLTYIAAIGPTIAKQSGPTGVAMTVAALLSIVLNFLLVPRYGKIGSAAATFAAQAVTPVYLFYRAQQIYPIPYRFGAAVAVYALSLALIGVGISVNLHGLSGVLVKLLLLALFFPLLARFDVLTRARTRALLSAVRSYAR